jgi:LytS/YehU family sensor histidine kinase
LALLNAFLPFGIIGFTAVTSFSHRLALSQLSEQKEKEKHLVLEKLNFLRDQFNSHMTFNFLNFCYAKVLPNSKEAAEAIELYSNMLTYSLLITPNDYVPISKEVAFIADFIGLQRCLNGKVCVEFIQEGVLRDKMILPRILSSLVENAFKHGQFLNESFPIRIILRVKQNEIIFSVLNKKDNRRKVPKSGIGKKNIAQMLDLWYKSRYRLEIKDNPDEYFSELTLLV